MFNANRLRRSAITGALACALVAATTATAAARTVDHVHCRVQLGAGLGYVPCNGHHSARTRSSDSPRLVAAQAQERYYSTYGKPSPPILAQTPAPASRTPWPLIALAIALALAIVAASATRLRRLRVRRHAPRATT